MILRLLRSHNPCSKADLMRHSGLSAPTISHTIDYLRQFDLVEYVGEGVSTGGRPPSLLRFNSKRGFIAGVDLGGTRLRVMLADLNGDVADQWSIELKPEQKNPASVCDLVLTGLKEVCQRSGTTTSKILKLVAGAPGITNVDEGVVISAPNLRDWHEVPLRAMLEQTTGISTIIENDVNLAAVGEHWRGAAINVDNFVFIGIGTGIGAGIFLRGELHHGANWSAGEIGYLKVKATTKDRLHIDEVGQMERAIGGAGIESLWHKEATERENSRGSTSRDGGANDRNLHHHRERCPPRLHARQIFDLAGQGDAAAIKLVSFVARILTDAVASISLVLNPELIVLGGGVGAHPVLCQATKRLVDNNEFARPRLTISKLGTQAQLHGTIYTALAAVEDSLLQQFTS
jgi:glucokinase